MTRVLAGLLDQRTSIELPRLLLGQVVFRTINPTSGKEEEASIATPPPPMLVSTSTIVEAVKVEEDQRNKSDVEEAVRRRILKEAVQANATVV